MKNNLVSLFFFLGVALSSLAQSSISAIGRGGGASNDGGYGVEVDGSGNVYVTGFFQGTSTFGSTSITSTGFTDVFLAKYNNVGILQWVQKAGGTSGEIGYDIAVDHNDNVYITGYFNATATFGNTSITSSGSTDIFVAKYDNMGILQWVQKAGGTSLDYGKSIDVDGNGNVYVTGFFYETATFGTTSITSFGDADIFISKYNSNGTLQWVQQAGGSGTDYGNGISVDRSNNVYLTGQFRNTANIGSTSLTSAGLTDIFVAKYNDLGTPQWGQKAGGLGFDIGNSIDVDGIGNIYITGYFAGTSTFGVTTISADQSFDVFVAKYSSAGTPQWVLRAGGTRDDYGNNIVVDDSGNSYITGNFYQTATFGSTNITSAGNDDIFVAKYNNSGIFQWVQKGGGSGTDYGYGITINSGGNVYLTGQFLDTATFGISSITSAGLFDIFVALIQQSCPNTLTPTGTITTNQKAATSVISTGTNIIPNSSNVVYQAGNYVQLNAGFSAVSSSVFTAKILAGCQ